MTYRNSGNNPIARRELKSTELVRAMMTGGSPSGEVPPLTEDQQRRDEVMLESWTGRKVAREEVGVEVDNDEGLTYIYEDRAMDSSEPERCVGCGMPTKTDLCRCEKEA